MIKICQDTAELKGAVEEKLKRSSEDLESQILVKAKTIRRCQGIYLQMHGASVLKMGPGGVQHTKHEDFPCIIIALTPFYG